MALYDGDILVRVDYKQNKVTVGCNGNYLYITVDQFKELYKIMTVANAYVLIASADDGE